MLQHAAGNSAFVWPRADPIAGADGGVSMASSSVARRLLDRDDLLQMPDRAVGKRVTVISAPAGSGKTSLLRAWADHSTTPRRVAFVAVDRDEQHAERFWSAVLGAISSAERSIEPEAQPAASAA